MFELGGEHWCSVCEEDLSKHKGTYVKLYWRGADEDGAEKISVVCPDCMKKDKVLDKGLKLLEDVAKPVEVSRGRVCSFCGTPVKKRERSLRVEFRYDGSELRADVCEKCIDEHEEIKSIHVKAPNPVFNVKVNCISAGTCSSFKKPKRDKGINCLNIVANMDGELYCRKAHPGYLRIYRERYAIPPSRKKLVKMITELIPMYDKIKNGATLLAEETTVLSREEASVAQRTIPDFPETVKYEVKEFEIDDSLTIEVPWKAILLGFGSNPSTIMALIRKDEAVDETI